MFLAACKYDAAIEKFELSAKIHYALNGECENYAHAVNNLANALSDSDHNESALVWREIVVKLDEKLLGSDHEESAKSHHNLANTLFALRRYDEAQQHIEQALLVEERIFGSAHVQCAGSLATLGNILLKQSQLDAAACVYERALPIVRAADKVPVLGALLHNIGSLYSKQGRLDMALEKFRESLSCSYQLVGENHTQTACALNSVGDVLYKKGDFDGAIQHLQHSLTIYEKAIFCSLFAISVVFI